MRVSEFVVITIRTISSIHNGLELWILDFLLPETFCNDIFFIMY